MTNKDLKDLKTAIDLKTDWIALSFVQRPEDLVQTRKIIKDNAAIITKIEKPAALNNLEEIVNLSDAVMVARGDLGVEYPIEKLPTVQKLIIKKCNKAKKFVIVATEMMLNMMQKPRPSRAETTDVANAVYDGADAVMTSEETAMGNYPVETIKYMRKITNEAWRSKYGK